MTQTSPGDTHSLVYRFEFEDGTSKDFEIQLDTATLELTFRDDPPKPEWTRLQFHQCENCPLDNSREHCPVAVNLGRLVMQFADVVSYTKTSVTILTKERTFHKDTTVQKGLSALIGIYMVTSNCPIMDKLRPMVRFHLPFATLTETAYRAITMYLMAQFFRVRRGQKPDWEMHKLADIYKAISFVNKGISARVSAASKKDANVNAVVILNSLGDSVPYAIENGLAELEPLFHTYLEELERGSSS